MPLAPSELLLLLQLVPIALFCLLLLAALGAPCAAVVSEHAAQARKRVFYDKFGLQMANMSLRLTLVGLIVSAAGTVFAVSRLPQFYPAAALPLYLTCGGLGLLFAAQVYLYNASWKAMKEHKGQHKLLGATARVVGIALLVLVLAVKRWVLVHRLAVPEMGFAEMLRALLAQPPSSALWPAVVQGTALSVAAAGAVGLVYLLLRRRIEDYGRDYYNFALHAAARWALLPGLAQLAALGWLVWALREDLAAAGPAGAAWTANPLLLLAVAAGALGLIACALWLAVRRNRNPLRLKATILAAFVFLGASLACETLMVLRLLPPIPGLPF